MHFRIDPAVFALFPDSLCGIVVLIGINNRTASRDPHGLLKQAAQEARAMDLTDKNPRISQWISAFRQQDVDIKKYPPSIVSMSSSVLKGKPFSSINPAVDLYNSASLKRLIPMGGYDLDQVTGDMEIRLSKKGDKFRALGKEDYEKLEPGVVAFVDQNEVMCARWAWKQSDHHKTAPNTRNLLIRVEGLGILKEELKEATDEIAQLVQKFCGGEYKTFLLSRDNPSVDLSYAKNMAKSKKASKEDLAISEILNRGTVDVIVRKNLEEKLHSGKKFRIKLGIDPSGSDLHLGHMVPVKKMREFQKAGHHILLLFGNFTGQIGDPTGKTEARSQKTQAELEKNAETYIQQVSKVLDVDNVEVVWNADWLAPLNFADVVRLSSLFTVSQMLERDMYQERVKKEIPIYVHEFMYPLMQGYDSVALKADVEVGGTDQTFNLLAGRTLQKAYGQKPQNVVTVPILEGMDGKIKMGKTENNYIGVMEPPNEQYGKVMSIPDDLILRYFELATEVPLSDISEIRKQMAEGMNPRDAKMRLGREIVSLYHGEDDAKKAEQYFIKVFQKKDVAHTKMPEVLLGKNVNILDVIVANQLASSKGEAKRLIQQGGVKFNEEKVSDISFSITNEGILQVGKRKFIKIIKS